MTRAIGLIATAIAASCATAFADEAPLFERSSVDGAKVWTVVNRTVVATGDETATPSVDFPHFTPVAPIARAAQAATASVDFPHFTPASPRLSPKPVSTASVDFPHFVPRPAGGASADTVAVAASVDFPHFVPAAPRAVEVVSVEAPDFGDLESRRQARVASLDRTIGAIVGRSGFTAGATAETIDLELSLLTDPTIFAIDVETASIPSAPLAEWEAFEADAYGGEEFGADYGFSYFGEFYVYTPATAGLHDVGP